MVLYLFMLFLWVSRGMRGSGERAVTCYAYHAIPYHGTISVSTQQGNFTIYGNFFSFHYTSPARAGESYPRVHRSTIHAKQHPDGRPSESAKTQGEGENSSPAYHHHRSAIVIFPSSPDWLWAREDIHCVPRRDGIPPHNALPGCSSISRR